MLFSCPLVRFFSQNTIDHHEEDKEKDLGKALPRKLLGLRKEQYHKEYHSVRRKPLNRWMSWEDRPTAWLKCSSTWEFGHDEKLVWKRQIRHPCVSKSMKGESDLHDYRLVYLTITNSLEENRSNRYWRMWIASLMESQRVGKCCSFWRRSRPRVCMRENWLNETNRRG